MLTFFYTVFITRLPFSRVYIVIFSSIIRHGRGSIICVLHKRSYVVEQKNYLFVTRSGKLCFSNSFGKPVFCDEKSTKVCSRCVCYALHLFFMFSDLIKHFICHITGRKKNDNLKHFYCSKFSLVFKNLH